MAEKSSLLKHPGKNPGVAPVQTAHPALVLEDAPLHDPVVAPVHTPPNRRTALGVALAVAPDHRALLLHGPKKPRAHLPPDLHRRPPCPSAPHRLVPRPPTVAIRLLRSLRSEMHLWSSTAKGWPSLSQQYCCIFCSLKS